MNKKVLILLLMFIPFLVNAKECDQTKHNEYLGLSSSITYDYKYSKSTSRFTIDVYNIFEGMYIKSGNKVYTTDGKKSTISDIREGSSVMLYVYADDGCDEIKIITFEAPYYNQYYGTTDCQGYEDKLVICASQFTEAPVTKELLKVAKENYNKPIQDEGHEKEEVKEDGIISIIKEYIQKWGIKVLLVVVTLFVAITLFGTKYRKIKHGI